METIPEPRDARERAGFRRPSDAEIAATRYAQFLRAAAPCADLGRGEAAEELAVWIAAAPWRCKRSWAALVSLVAEWNSCWLARGAVGTSPLGALAELLVNWRPRAGCGRRLTRGD